MGPPFFNKRILYNEVHISILSDDCFITKQYRTCTRSNLINCSYAISIYKANNCYYSLIRMRFFCNINQKFYNPSKSLARLINKECRHKKETGGKCTYNIISLAKPKNMTLIFHIIISRTKQTIKQYFR